MNARLFAVFAIAASVTLFVVSLLPPASDQVSNVWQHHLEAEIFPAGNITSTPKIREAIGSTQPSSSESVSSNAKTVEVLGHSGGSSRGIFVQGQYAYAGYGPEMALLDISNPARPWRVGYVLLPAVPQNIYVVGHYAYVADGEAGLRIINISNPAKPQEAGSYTSSYAAGIWVDNNFAYVVGHNYFHIIDVSNVAAPVEIGQFVMPADARPEDLAVQGRYAYVADPWLGLRVIDVLTPTTPIQVASFSSLNALNVAIVGHYAYLTGEALFILDISNPLQPTVAGIYTNSTCASSISFARVADSYAYVGLCRKLLVLDVSNPASPRPLGYYEGDIGPFAIANSHAFVTGFWEGQLQIVDVSTPVSLTLTGSYQAPTYPKDTAIVGDYAYIADTYADFRILNVSNPAAPYQVSSLYQPNNPQGVAIVNGYAYLAKDNLGLAIINVADPFNPTELGSYDTPGDAMQVAVTGTYAFVADRYNGGLQVIDVSNPLSPTQVSSCCLSGDVWDVALAGNYAYLANSVKGLRIVDITNPRMLTDVASLDTPGWASGVALAGNYAYLADDSGGLRIVDVSTPTAPIEIGASSTGGKAQSVALDGQYAYVANEDGSLHVMDISNPRMPIDVGFYNSPNPTGAAYGVGVAAHNGRIYFSDWFMGFYILQYGSSINGRVTDANQRPFTNVSITISSSVTTTVDEAGMYTFTHLLSDTYTPTPASNDFVFWPASRTVTVPPDAMSQDFVVLPAPVSMTLTPSMTTAVLQYTDMQGLVTQLNFSANAVTQTTTLLLTPTVASPGAGFTFSGHAFDLTALPVEHPQSAFTFNAPVTVTVHYSDYDVRLSSSENELRLFWWNGSDWQDAAQTCEPASSYLHDVASNMLQVSICRTGRFGLFGPTHQIFLPIIFRSWR